MQMRHIGFCSASQMINKFYEKKESTRGDKKRNRKQEMERKSRLPKKAPAPGTMLRLKEKCKAVI